MVPGYALVLGKGGPKLKAGGYAESVRRFIGPKGPQIKRTAAMAKLADVLSQIPLTVLSSI